MAFAALPFLQQMPRRLERLANTSAARAVREGLLWVVPTLLLAELFLFLAIAGRYLGLSAEIASMLMRGHHALNTMIPMLIAAAIAYFLTLQHHLPRLPVAFLCLGQVLLATVILSSHPQLLPAIGIAIALLTPLAVVPFLARLVRQSWMPAVRIGIVNDNLREMLNMLLPGLIATALFLLAIHVLREPLVWLLDYRAVLPDHDSPYLGGFIVTGLDSLLWFFGIHGFHALTPVFQYLDQAVAANAIDLANVGTGHRILNSSQLGSFVFIGGSGATFALALCLVLACRNQTLRLLGIASLPLAFMNVNEILLFGLPIILNPRLFLPFLIAPMVNLVISLGVISLGFVSPASVQVPLTSPMFFNAYWASGGEINAVLLQLGLIFVSFWIYLPFAKALDRRGNSNEVIAVHSLDTTFTRLHEEASLYSYDPVSHASALRRQQAEENQHIRQIAEYEFFLEFQPQVAPRDGSCPACEALLRARSPSGQIRTPAEFLEWLERAGLIRDLDLWVANAAVEQYWRWQADGFATRISINVTGYTLTDPDYRRQLIELLAPVGPGFIVEITENALLSDVEGVKEGMLALHQIGTQIAIDDFGTGYSALSYLHQFSVDKIKIDRSFVLASATPRGQSVLEGLLAFGERLGLSIIVEGVETESQRDLLDIDGELLVQGWLYSRSLSAEDFVNFVQGRATIDCA